MFVKNILLRLLVCDSFTIVNLFVVGQEQHVGTKAPPPEIVLENAVMRTEPAIVRVQVIYLKIIGQQFITLNYY